MVSRWLSVVGAVVATALPVDGTAQTPETRPTTSSANLAYLVGTGWEGPGSRSRDIITFEYGNTWAYGDAFTFFDLSHLGTRTPRDEGPGTLIYAEVHKRFSIGRIFGVCACAGPVTDVLTAHEINVSGTGSLAHLHGVGLAWRLPGGGLKTNAYVRDDRDQPGATWQVLIAGQFGFEVAGQQWSIGGFTDVMGGEGVLASNLFSAIQFLWAPGGGGQGLRIGVEMHSSLNHLGREGVDEFVPQGLIKWMF